MTDSRSIHVSTNDETFYSGIPPLGRYPEKTVIQKNKCVPVFIAALFTIARTWKQPKCPSTDEWIKTGTYTPWNVTHP